MSSKDKVAVVTGSAGKGMGRSIALTLAREGASVIVNYLNSKDRANEVVEYIEGKGGSAIAVQANVFVKDGCEKLIDVAIKQFERVDICVINPGAGWHPEPLDVFDPVLALEDLIQEIAPFFHLMRLLLPGMYDRQWGRLVGITLHPVQSSPAYSYNVGKAARLQAMHLAYEEAWEQGVTINAIAPGPVSHFDTFQQAIAYCNHEKEWSERKNVSPQDIAEAIAFLCSDGGSYISGSVIPFMFHKKK